MVGSLCNIKYEFTVMIYSNVVTCDNHCSLHFYLKHSYKIILTGSTMKSSDAIFRKGDRRKIAIDRYHELLKYRSFTGFFIAHKLIGNLNLIICARRGFLLYGKIFLMEPEFRVAVLKIF